MASLWPAFAMVCAVLVLGWAVGSLFIALGSTLLASLLPAGALAAAGLIVAAFQIAAGVTQFLCRRLPAGRAIRLGCMLLAAGWAGCTFSLAQGLAWGFCLFTLLCGVGYGASFVGAMGHLAAIAPAEHRGTLSSLFYVAGYLGSALGILGIGALIDAAGLLPTMRGAGRVRRAGGRSDSLAGTVLIPPGRPERRPSVRLPMAQGMARTISYSWGLQRRARPVPPRSRALLRPESPVSADVLSAAPLQRRTVK
ncbi:hypothetical protein ACFS3C_10010 [Azotobacter vinelandii]